MKLVKNEDLLYAAKRINLEISEISYGYLDSEWNNENLCASFTRIYVPLSGEGSIRFGQTSLLLCPGNIYVVPSGLNFSSECLDRMEKIYIHLTLTHPDGSDVFSGIHHPLVLSDAADAIRTIRDLYHVPKLTSVLRLRTVLLELLLAALEREIPDSEPIRSYAPITKAALAYIDSHLSADLSIDTLAKELIVSRQTLQKRFRDDLGKPIGKYIDESLMARAERALLDTSATVKEISDSLGYCDQFYFSRRFTETHGVSPKRFRLAHRV